MLYAVGSKIDLSSLNTPRQEVAGGRKKSPNQERDQDCGKPSRLYQVGTKVIFDRITLAARIRIPVTFA